MKLQSKLARFTARWSLTPEEPVNAVRVPDCSWADNASVDSGFALALLPGQPQAFRAQQLTGVRKMISEPSTGVRPAKMQRIDYHITENVGSSTRQRTSSHVYAMPGDFDDFPRTSAAAEHVSRSAWNSVSSIWTKPAATSRPSEWEALPRERRVTTAVKSQFAAPRNAPTSPAASFSMFREDLF
jgi:hypothetical protein